MKTDSEGLPLCACSFHIADKTCSKHRWENNIMMYLKEIGMWVWTGFI